MNALTRLLVWTLTAVVAVRFVLYLGMVGFGFAARQDVTYPEGAVIYAVRRVAAGEPLYQDFRRPPHVAVLYGPVFFYLAGWADRAWGTGVFGSYVVSRSVTYGAYAALVGLFAAWASKLSGGWTRGLFLTLLMAACPPFWGVGVSAKPDTLALLGSTACLYVAARPWGAWRWLPVWLLAIVAWTTKQSAVALVPALAVFLFRTRGVAAAAAWLAAWLAGIAAVWLALDRSTDGMFTLNTFVALGRPLDWLGAWHILRDHGIHLVVVLALAACAWPQAEQSDALRLPAWWFFFALPIGVASLLGEGSGTNYLLEAWVAACLLVANLLGRWISNPGSALAVGSESVEPTFVTNQAAPRGRSVAVTRAHVLAWIGLTHLIGVGVLDAIVLRRDVAGQTILAARTPTRDRQMGVMPKLIPVVLNCPGEVFVEYPYVALVSQRPAVVLDVLHYRQLVDRGVVSGDILAGQFADQRYALVVLSEGLEADYNRKKLMRWPEVVWSALVEHYRFAGRVDGYSVYVPAERDE